MNYLISFYSMTLYIGLKHYIYAFVSLLSDFLPISIVKYLADGTFSGYAPTGSQTFDQSIIKLIFDVPNIIELHNNNDSNQR